MGEDYEYDYNYDLFDYDDSPAYTEATKPVFIDRHKEFTAKVGDEVTFPCNIEESKFSFAFYLPNIEYLIIYYNMYLKTKR